MIPQQQEGIKKDLRHSIVMETIEDAEDLFIIAKEKLLDVHNWGKAENGVSADFTVADHNGHEVHRSIHKGDHIKIRTDGDSVQWMMVTSVEYDDYPDENAESIEMTICACNPAGAAHDKDTAHEADNKPGSTFIVERVMQKVFAYYYGTNEMPYIAPEHITDKPENTAMPAAAMFGISAAQWDNLIKSFLEFDE